jgi:hypothetical protein
MKSWALYLAHSRKPELYIIQVTLDNKVRWLLSTDISWEKAALSTKSASTVRTVNTAASLTAYARAPQKTAFE